MTGPRPEWVIYNMENGHASAITFPSKESAEREMASLVASYPAFTDLLGVARIRKVFKP